MEENPYSPPSAPNTPANESPSTINRKSARRFVGMLFFAFLSGGVYLIVYRGITIMTWAKSGENSQTVIIRGYLSLFLVASAGLIWLWTARSFWLARYRHGFNAAAFGFLAFVAGVIIGPMFTELTP